MGFWAQHVVPHIIDKGCGLGSLHPLRAHVCEGLAGEVVELGFGSGLNVPFYPAAVTSVAAVEPSDVGWRLAAQRVASSPVPVRRAGLDGQSLPFPDHSFDAALSTWTLCTVPDAARALAELRRVLRPGALLHFVEHGLAPDAGVRRLQRRLEPVNRRLLAGCHLTRSPAGLVQAAGFTLTELDVSYDRSAPKFVGAFSRGVAEA